MPKTASQVLKCDAAERKLAQLEAARRLAPSQIAALGDEVRRMVAREADAASDPTMPDLLRHSVAFEKWRAVHRYLHRTPFRDRSYAKRSEQWRDALGRLRNLGDPELIDWICLQIEVATNIERGVQDLRPRDDGPAFIVLLEYVANRKRKALAVLKWHIAAENQDELDQFYDRSA